MKCHMCGNNAEELCVGCKEPVCESCMTPYTIHTPVEYCECRDCAEMITMRRFDENERKEEKRMVEQNKKDEINRLARERYNSPEKRKQRQEQEEKESIAEFGQMVSRRLGLKRMLDGWFR